MMEKRSYQTQDMIKGVIILNLNYLTVGGQDKGFAILLNKDLSVLDTLTFKQDESNVLDSLIKSLYGDDLNGIAFLTRDPDEISEWYPESMIGSFKYLASKFGINLDKYFGKNNLLDQSFDMLDLLVREAGI